MAQEGPRGHRADPWSGRLGARALGSESSPALNHAQTPAVGGLVSALPPDPNALAPNQPVPLSCSSALVQSVLSSYQLGERSGRIKITQLVAVRARPTLAAGQGSPGRAPGRGGRHCPASSDRLLLLAERRRHRADPEPDRVRLQAPESPSAPGAAGTGQAPERLPSAAEDTAHCFWVLGGFFDIISDLEQNHIPVWFHPGS